MVRIIIGSKNDQTHLAEMETIFKDFEIDYEIHVYSCHRNLKELVDFLDKIKSGEHTTDVIVGVANSVDLPAIIAGYVKDAAVPVIGVGLSGGRMSGVDSLLSVNTIPRRVPLLNAGLDGVGMYNAALACLNILAVENKDLKKRLSDFYKSL